MAGDAALEDRYLVIDAPALARARIALGRRRGEELSAKRHAQPARRFGCRFSRHPTRFGAIITVTPEELALREALETEANMRERLSITTSRR